MHTIKYVHWQEGDWWVGYLEECPDYWTQGETLADLVKHLKDLYLDLSGGHIPGAPARNMGVMTYGSRS